MPASPQAGRALRALILALAASACGVEEGSPPNVLWISLDSTRRDLVGAYGYRHPNAPELSPSPNIDRLAREGVLFEHAYATTSWTLPSHVSMLTGRSELEHGVDLDHHRPSAAVASVGELLGERGYRTAGFFSGPYLEPRFGFARGFERYQAAYSETLTRASARYQEAQRALDEALALGAAAERERRALRAAGIALQVASHRDRSSQRVTDGVLEELEHAAASSQPFFVFAHYFDPHYDYLPPPPFDTRFDPHYEGAIDGADFLTDPEISVRLEDGSGRRRQVLGERDLSHVWALYAGELAWTDAAIGRILARLDELELASDTLIVLTADHGDEFFEHGYLGHRNNLYEESLRVPLILRLPGVLPAGRRVEALVSTVDLFATTLELCGIPVPAGVSSRSLVPLALGAASELERGVFARLVRALPARADGAPVTLYHVTETFRQGAIKVTREARWVEPHTPPPGFQPKVDQELRWIDLEAHPDEHREDHSENFDDPRARRTLASFDRYYAAALASRAQPAEAGLDAELRQRLSALGYGEGGSPHSNQSGWDTLVLPPPGHHLLAAE